MKHHRLTLGDPFFGVSLIENAETWQIDEPTIVLNIGTEPIRVEAQQLAPLQSAVLVNTEIRDLERVVLVEGFADHSDEVALMERVRATWPSAYEVRGEDRLKGVEHYMSPKVWIGQTGLTLYHLSLIHI